ncbi:MAG TPA: enoyl-CoA hydratase-related protein [Baekduia sp.]
MAAASAPVRVTVADGVAEILLDRPEAGNAIDPALAAALRAAVEEVVDRADARVIVLAASGPVFCVGGDLQFMAARASDASTALQDLADELHAGLRALAGARAPVIAKVQGVAAGAGLSLVCAADLAYAADTATLTAAYSAVGLSPDGGMSWTLPRLVGRRRAAELMLTNRRVAADEAAAMGLITAAVTAAGLDDHVRSVATRLAAGPAAAHAAIKALLRASPAAGLSEQLEREAASIASLAGSATGLEGVAAFLEKRPPHFPER